MSKKDIIRVGDMIEVTDHTKWIDRIGYTLHYSQFTKSVENSIEGQKILDILDGTEGKYNYTASPSFYNFRKLPDYLTVAIAKYKVEQQNFGGRERKIFYRDQNTIGCCYDGKVKLKVIGKRTAKTGKYFSPSGSYDPYTGESDYWPGGLEDSKTHVILCTAFGDIEQIHCRKI